MVEFSNDFASSAERLRQKEFGLKCARATLLFIGLTQRSIKKFKSFYQS